MRLSYLQQVVLGVIGDSPLLHQLDRLEDLNSLTYVRNVHCFETHIVRLQRRTGCKGEAVSTCASSEGAQSA